MSYEIVEYLKEHTDLKSDYQIHKKLEISKAKINGWKRLGSKADAKTLLKMMKYADISAEKAIEIIEGKELETALFKRRICALNIKVNEYINPRKINYLRNVKNLTNSSQNIHYTQLLNIISLVKSLVNKRINYFFSLIQSNPITV